MNKLLLFSLIGLMLFTTGFSSLNDGLLAYYGFEDNLTLEDSFASYDGVNYGAITVTAGKIDNCYNYPGLGTVFSNITKDLGNKINESTTASISVWLKLVTASVSGGKTGLFRVSSSILANQYPYTSGTIYLNTFHSQVSFDKGGIPFASWHLFTVTTTPGANNYKFYVNETLIYETTGESNLLTNDIYFLLGRDPSGTHNYYGAMDSLMFYDRVLTPTEISEIYNSGNGRSYDYINPIIPIVDYNVTTILDNTTWVYSNSTSNYFIEFNVSTNFLVRTYNSTGDEVTQNLTISNADLGLFENLTSGTNYSITLTNDSVNNYDFWVYNSFNESVSYNFTVNNDEIDDILPNYTTTFYKFNTTFNVSFFGNHSDFLSGITCNDHFNLTIPQLNITNEEYDLCENITLTLNNSLIYNYSLNLIHDEHRQFINKTYYLTTNAYNISIPTYNQTIANNTNADVKWYLTTLPNYLTSAQGVNVSIQFNSTTYYPTASGLNYSYNELLTSTDLVETIPFYLILNLTSGTESLLFNTSYTQSITTLQLDDCSTYTTILMWLNVKDELDLDRTDLVPNSSTFMSFNVNDTYFTLNIDNDGDGMIPVCINNTVNFTANVYFSYTAVNFGALTKPNREHFFFNNYFNTAFNQSFYKLPNASAEKIIFNLVDNAQQPLQEYYLEIKKWYGDSYNTIAMAKTDMNGQAITYVEYNIPSYAFDIRDSDGNLIDSTENIILTTTPTTIQVSLGGASSYFVDNRTYGVINEWNNSTEYFTTIISNSEGVDTTYNLFVYYSNGTIICSETSTQTTSYTTMCEVPEWETNTFIVKGSVIRNTDGRVLNLYNYLIDDRIPTTPTFDTDEGLLWLAIMMIVSSVGIVAVSPSFLPLSPTISLLLTNILGLTSLSPFIIGGLAVTGIILMLWFMKT